MLFKKFKAFTDYKQRHYEIVIVNNNYNAQIYIKIVYLEIYNTFN